jgi:hypothetical protein
MILFVVFTETMIGACQRYQAALWCSISVMKFHRMTIGS